ncbi:MAG: hypothetical protein ACXAC7_06280 [Candidatus Hodarchaeales archaeon]|jgi:uncharacterized protein YndB with AHSA1/START domain
MKKTITLNEEIPKDIENVWKSLKNLLTLEHFFSGKIVLEDKEWKKGTNFQVRTKGIIKEVFTKGYTISEMEPPYRLIIGWKGKELLTDITVEWNFNLWKGHKTTLLALKTTHDTSGMPSISIPIISGLLRKIDLEKRFKSLVNNIIKN